MRPGKGTYPAYYDNYIPLVKQNSILDALLENEKEIKRFFLAIPDSQENFAYAPGKWSIKEVLNHVIDTERIFAYRALRFARKDQKQPLSFEENDYVANAALEGRNLQDLVNEFETVRKATFSLYQSFNDETLKLSGQTAGGPASVIAIGFTICGHAIHHMNVVSERYLKK